MSSTSSNAIHAGIASSHIIRAAIRHCPKCQTKARAKWLAQRESELLPVPYFQVVFTLPQKIGGLALQNEREIYRLQCSGDAAHDRSRPQAPGDRISICILICIVSFPAAASVRTAFEWIGCKKRSFFLPVEVLSSRFRNLFLIYLREAFQAGRLKFHGEMAGLAQPAAFEALCRQARRIQCVFVKFRCWKDSALYDDARYIQSLRRRASPLTAILDKPALP
jgi:hypothetical protein